MSIFSRVSRKPRAEVTLPLAEWHATTLAIDGLVEHNDELQRLVDEHCATIENYATHIDDLTAQRDRARRWAVHLEQDVADLDRVNAELRQQLAAAEVHGVTA